MPYPPMDTIKKTLGKKYSKYSLTVLIAKRAQQLKQNSEDKDFTELIAQALDEVAEGKVDYKTPEELEREREDQAKKEEEAEEKPEE